VAAAARHLLPQRADLLGVLEGQPIAITGERHGVGLSLGRDGVAGVAVVGDEFPVGRLMLAVVAAAAAGEHEMTDVVRVLVPPCLHQRKEAACIDRLHLTDGVDDRVVPARDQGRVILLVEPADRVGDSLRRRVARSVLRGQRFDRRLLDEGER